MSAASNDCMGQDVHTERTPSKIQLIDYLNNWLIVTNCVFVTLWLKSNLVSELFILLT